MIVPVDAVMPDGSEPRRNNTNNSMLSHVDFETRQQKRNEARVWETGYTSTFLCKRRSRLAWTHRFSYKWLVGFVRKFCISRRHFALFTCPRSGVSSDPFERNRLDQRNPDEGRHSSRQTRSRPKTFDRSFGMGNGMLGACNPAYLVDDSQPDRQSLRAPRRFLFVSHSPRTACTVFVRANFRVIRASFLGKALMRSSVHAGAE
jgi:hypothetical protein